MRWLLLTVAILLTPYLVGGIQVTGFFAAFFAAAALGILNALLRPLLLILTLPINIFTFGLFTLVINGLLLKMVSGVVPGFRIYGFWSAVFGSLIISLVSWLLSSFINEKGRIDYIDLKRRGGNRWE
jgi:putative membrane protein